MLLIPGFFLGSWKKRRPWPKQSATLGTRKVLSILEGTACVSAQGTRFRRPFMVIVPASLHGLMIRIPTSFCRSFLIDGRASRRSAVLPVFLMAFFLISQTDGLKAQESTLSETDLLLFDFESQTEARWGIVNDGVMGGRSKGNGRIEDGSLHFWGTLVTRGGGFTSVRARKRFNLQGYEGVALRVRGSGRTFEVELDDGLGYRGRSISRRAPFDTSEEWRVVRIPFSAFRSSIFGRPVNAGALDPSRIEAVGLYLLDGKDGGFDMEVDAIWAYRGAL